MNLPLRRHPSARLALLTCVALSGCLDSLLVSDGPANTPEGNFDELWAQVDRHYAFFEQKGIDWDALHDQYRPRVSSGTGDRELFGIMSELLGELRDGHTTLWTPLGTYRFTGWYDAYPENFDWELARAQLSALGRNGEMVYGRLTPEIGYVYVPAFSERNAGDMGTVLEALAGVRAMVVDVRDNGGGTTNALPQVIGPFVDQRRVYAGHRFRDGPAHDDFSRLFEDAVEPRGTHFGGPVAVLTNRRSFSTTEDFVLACQVIPTMFTVGDTTGGGTGNPILRELPNGWIFRVSRQIQYGPDGAPILDGRGLAPDYPVQLDESDVGRGVDTIIARAVELLQARLAGG